MGCTTLPLVFVGLLVCALLPVEAWGPLSHYYFAKQAFPQANQAALKLGCDMPDGFYFANWAQYPNCSVSVDDMHNGVMPGYLVRFAQSAAGQRFKRDGFEPLDLALAFGSHVYADVVGFHGPKGGYLGPSVPNYATTWVLMTAIDALVSHRVEFASDSKLWSPIAAEFVAAGTQFAHAANSKYNAYNASAVQACNQNWGIAGLGLIQAAKLQAETVYYQKALIMYDQFNATKFEQTEHNFNLNNECAVLTIQFWANLLLKDPSVTPEAAFSQSYAFAQDLYKKGACTPVPV
eukprot:TRINITY_DN623_c0_g1_i1.p1 TRINITY_DN623_c0_g1~~TRINITY_DN623_c0_g1_i1.p1  ORF type:complete len:300 (-),score=38.87 TRINITY_DN623_c0_g1_i1:37-912(-)